MILVFGWFTLGLSLDRFTKPYRAHPCASVLKKKKNSTSASIFLQADNLACIIFEKVLGFLFYSCVCAAELQSTTLLLHFFWSQLRSKVPLTCTFLLFIYLFNFIFLKYMRDSKYTEVNYLCVIIWDFAGRVLY